MTIFDSVGDLLSGRSCQVIAKEKHSKTPAVIQAVALGGGVGVALLSAYYGFEQYGPTPGVLLGSLIVGGVWFAVVTGGACMVRGGDDLLTCTLGSVADVAGNLVGGFSKSLLGVRLNPASMVDDVLGAAVQKSCK